jgi:hypothetical protein
MKTHPSSFRARHTVTKLLLISGIALLTAVPPRTIYAQNPSSGTVGPAPGGPTATWQGTATAPGGGVNTEAACIDGVNCEVYTLSFLAERVFALYPIEGFFPIFQRAFKL